MLQLAHHTQPLSMHSALSSKKSWHTTATVGTAVVGLAVGVGAVGLGVGTALAAHSAGLWSVSQKQHLLNSSHSAWVAAEKHWSLSGTGTHLVGAGVGALLGVVGGVGDWCLVGTRVGLVSQLGSNLHFPLTHMQPCQLVHDTFFFCDGHCFGGCLRGASAVRGSGSSRGARTRTRR